MAFPTLKCATPFLTKPLFTLVQSYLTLETVFLAKIAGYPALLYQVVGNCEFQRFFPSVQ